LSRASWYGGGVATDATIRGELTVRSKNLIVLAVLVLALGAFILLIERHQPTTDEHRERADRVFAELSGDRVIAVDLQTGDGRIRLEKSDDVWRLTEPMDYPADAGAVRSLIQNLAGLEADRVLSLDEVDTADYGLAAPVIGVALVDDDGARFELAVGDETPLGGKRAVRRGSDDEILLCPGGFVAGLDKEVDHWRSRDVVDALESDLAAIEIETVIDRIRAVRVGDRWQLEEPVADLADGEQMRSLVSELNALRIGEFLPADTPSASVEPPEYRITLTRADEAEPVVLELGPPEEDGSSVICRRDGVEMFTIPDSIRARLGKAPVLWRSPKVWTFSSWDAGKVEIASADREVVLDRVNDDGLGGVWRFSDGEPADDAAVRRRLTALADLEAREHDLVLPPTEVMGSVIVVLDDDGGAEGLTYTFYAPIEDGGHAAVTVSARSNIMGVDAAVVAGILGDLDGLRAEPEVLPDDEGATGLE
jgi:hypothetical protein